MKANLNSTLKNYNAMKSYAARHRKDLTAQRDQAIWEEEVARLRATQPVYVAQLGLPGRMDVAEVTASGVRTIVRDLTVVESANLVAHLNGRS